MRKVLVAAAITALMVGSVLLFTFWEGQPPPFSCGELQRRAENCGPQVLSMAAEEIRKRASTDPRDDSAEQIKMFKMRAEKKLRNKETEKQCIRFSAASGAEYERRMTQMKTCYAQPGCEAFAKCQLGL
jgi:hypothetical protein